MILRRIDQECNIYNTIPLICNIGGYDIKYLKDEVTLEENKKGKIRSYAGNDLIVYMPYQKILDCCNRYKYDDNYYGAALEEDNVEQIILNKKVLDTILLLYENNTDQDHTIISDYKCNALFPYSSDIYYYADNVYMCYGRYVTIKKEQNETKSFMVGSVDIIYNTPVSKEPLDGVKDIELSKYYPNYLNIESFNDNIETYCACNIKMLYKSNQLDLKDFYNSNDNIKDIFEEITQSNCINMIDYSNILNGIADEHRHKLSQQIMNMKLNDPRGYMLHTALHILLKNVFFTKATTTSYFLNQLNK
jgi:hypothetical protein